MRISMAELVDQVHGVAWRSVDEAQEHSAATYIAQQKAAGLEVIGEMGEPVPESVWEPVIVGAWAAAVQEWEAAEDAN